VNKTIYYMYKPGDTRDYAMTTPPSPEWAKAMAEQGFKLFECLVEIPMDSPLEGYGDQVGPVMEVPLAPPFVCMGCGASTALNGLMVHKPDCLAIYK